MRSEPYLTILFTSLMAKLVKFSLIRATKSKNLHIIITFYVIFTF